MITVMQDGVGRFFFFVVILCAVAPLRGETLQPWPSAIVIAPLGAGWQASGEIIRRVGRTSTFNPQHEYRAELGHGIAPGLTLWAGYVRFDTYRATTAAVHEDQIIAQLNWTGFALGRARILSRTRLEARFVHGVDQTAWRIREQVRLVAPILPKANFVTWVEPFVALNHTPASLTRLDQFRAFAGVMVPVSKRIDVEIGYLHQILHRTTGSVVNHAIPIALTVRL